MGWNLWEEGDVTLMREINSALTEILPGGIAAFHLNRRDLLFCSPGLLSLVGLSRDDPALDDGMWYYRMIEPEDRAWIGREAARQLEEKGRSEIVYRLNRRDGSVLWVKQYAGMVENAQLGSYFLCLIVDYTETKRAQEKADRAEHQMNTLINTIPGGVARFSLDEEFHTLLASDGYYRLMGYSREEYAQSPIQNRAMSFVMPEDRPLIKKAIEELVERNRPVCVEYRLRKKDGSIAWNTAYGTRTEQMDGRLVVDAVMIDTTENKRLEWERWINAERYRIVSDQSQDIIFEWDLETGLIQHSAAIRQKLGGPFPEEMPIEQLLNGKYYPEETISVVSQMMENIRTGVRFQEREYAMHRFDGSDIWFRNRVTTIFDEEARPVRAIGILLDIDEYKRTAQVLREQAQRDSMTGLLNRMNMERKARHALESRTENSISAFYLIDIDDFKGINDSLGHDRGDVVLMSLASRVRAQFREQDLVGRMGGDEFAVLVADLPTEQAAEERAEQLCRALRGSEAAGQRLSASVGIALAPLHGESFEELYRHADVALYTAKRTGRDGWSVYEPPRHP